MFSGVWFLQGNLPCAFKIFMLSCEIRGGDFLYRWGNPENYHRGDSSTQKLFGQHDVRWIEKGNPGAGHLTVFNNNIPGKLKGFRGIASSLSWND